MTDQNTTRPETDNPAKTDRDLETLRERVKDRLRAVGRSQRDLEEAAGFSTGYVSKLLSGERPMKANTIRVLATTLDKFAGTTGGSTDEDLVAGTFYAAVLKAGDDTPTDVLFASLVAQLDEQRALVGEQEAGKAASDERAAAAERQVNVLEEKLEAAEKRAADAVIKSMHESARAERALGMLEGERQQRIAAEQAMARLRTRVELPQAVTLEDEQYLRALRQQGVTDWMSYGRLLERQKNELMTLVAHLEAELARERGKPGWGSAAVAFLAGVGTAAVVAADDQPKKKVARK